MTILPYRPETSPRLFQDLKCDVCNGLIKPPAYDCSIGHLICHICYDRCAQTCEICRKGLVTKCEILSSTLTVLDLPCPNQKFGCPCWVKLGNYAAHIEGCAYSAKLFCPICQLSPQNEILLRNHLLTHRPMEVTYGQASRILNATPGSYMLRESVTSNFYLLLISRQGLSVQHMQGGVVSPYIVGVRRNCSSWGYTGITCEVKRTPIHPPSLLKIPEVVYDSPMEIGVQINVPDMH